MKKECIHLDVNIIFELQDEIHSSTDDDATIFH